MAIREIIFRGKTEQGEWVYGDLSRMAQRVYISHFQPNNTYKDGAENTHLYKHLWVIPETVGQYVGIKDKNGKKIIEGDIVKFHTETYTSMRDTIGVVEYYNASYGIAYENNRHFLEFNNMTMYVRWYEIIGNIYDNPELLEV